MWPVSRSPGSPAVRNATTGEYGVTSASSYRASSRPLRAGRVTDNGFAYISTSARRDARRCHDRRLVQAVGSMPPRASLSSAVVTRNLTSSQEPLVAASHTLAVSSQLAVAIRVPSWLNATPTTQSVWPVRVNSSSPVAASHTLAVAGSSLGEVGVNPEGVLLLDLEDPDRVLRRTSSRLSPRPPPSSGMASSAMWSFPPGSSKPETRCSSTTEPPTPARPSSNCRGTRCSGRCSDPSPTLRTRVVPAIAVVPTGEPVPPGRGRPRSAPAWRWKSRGPRPGRRRAAAVPRRPSPTGAERLRGTTC